VRLSEAGTGTQITYTLTSSARLPLIKAPLAAVCQLLTRMLARAATRQN
jgi:hypothetical protein